MKITQLPLTLITHTLPDRWLEKLNEICQMEVGPPDADHLAPGLEEHLPEAEGLFSLLTIAVSEELLSKAPNLKVVSNMAVGYDNIDVAACTRRGIPVGNTPGVLTEGTADLTMALLLAAARKLPEASKDAREGRWTTWSPTGWLGADLHGATLGIVGMGEIGSAVARRAHGFGVRLVYTDNIPRPEIEVQLGATKLSLETLLWESDFVSLHVPLTDETHHLIDADALQYMKKTAILINAARGPIVDNQALHRALREGWISAAALDVTDPEPLPPTDPLYALPNCLIVPHIGSATQHTRRRMAELACDNLLAGLRGERLPHCVNPEVYQQTVSSG
ncbi:MAG: D-glycerate dehydrogenase [Chloroflexi bacterium]|nr:D-glycerate dehydrogenase [Chloroflexota bacterium]